MADEAADRVLSVYVTAADADEALQELNRSVAEINNQNQEITIVAEMWNGYHRNVEFNLQNMETSAAAGAGAGAGPGATA